MPILIEITHHERIDRHGRHLPDGWLEASVTAVEEKLESYRILRPATLDDEILDTVTIEIGVAKNHGVGRDARLDPGTERPVWQAWKNHDRGLGRNRHIETLVTR